MGAAVRTPETGGRPLPLLERLGLHRPELRAWAMYDWALSAMQTVIMAAVFPVFFVRVAAADLPGAGGTQMLAQANTIALAIAALLSPILGALTDYQGSKKRFLAVFTFIGVGGTAGMFFIQRGEVALASAMYIVALVGGTGCLVFYESLLPHLAPPDEVDRVSTAGYALGYLGGGVLLALNLAWIQMPALFGLPSGEGRSEGEATLPARLAFLSVAAWWALFSIPLFRGVREPVASIERDERPGESPVRAAFVRL